MKFLILFVIAIFGCSIATSTEDGFVKKEQFAIFKKDWIKGVNDPLKSSIKDELEDTTYVKYHRDAKTNQLVPTFTYPTHASINKLKRAPGRNPKEQGNSYELEKKEYVLITNNSGSVIILNSNCYEKVISFTLPDIAKTVVAIIDDTLYNIDAYNGMILSTNMENIMSGRTDINWKHVGSFPAERVNYIRNSATSHGSSIYFFTTLGNFYKYDTITKAVEKLANFKNPSTGTIAAGSEAVYLHIRDNFYSYDGTGFKLLNKTKNVNLGVFQLGNNVCLVGGGNPAEMDPMECYDPENQIWTVQTYINVARQQPAIARTKSGVCMFSGYQVGTSETGFPVNVWQDFHEKMDYETRVWSYIPDNFDGTLESPQAVTFYF